MFPPTLHSFSYIGTGFYVTGTTQKLTELQWFSKKQKWRQAFSFEKLYNMAFDHIKYLHQNSIDLTIKSSTTFIVALIRFFFIVSYFLMYLFYSEKCKNVRALMLQKIFVA